MTPLEKALCAVVRELLKQLRQDEEAFNKWHDKHATCMPTPQARAAYEEARKS